MKNVVFFIIALFPFSGQCQERFIKQFDTEFPFLAFTNIHPTDSCYYTTGVMTDSTGGLLTIGNTFHKFDLEGNIILQKTLGKPNKYYQVWEAGLISTDDEGLITLGLTTDSINKIAIIKYNNQGDTLFTKEFLNPYYPDEEFLYPATIRSNTQNGFWVLSGVDSDPNSSNVDVYLLNVDENGNVLAEYNFENAQTDTPYGLNIASNNSIIIGSRRSNLGQSGNDFTSRAHIFEINNMGEIQWEYLSPAFQLVDYPKTIITTPDGGLIAAGGKGIEYEINSSSSHLLWFPYFFKLDANHQLEWSREFRGLWQSLDFNIREMVAALDGSGYIGVSRISENVSTGEEALGSWIIKVSPEGDSLWARHYSFFDSLASKPTPYDIKNTPDGGYIVAGKTETRLTPGSLPVQRGWLLKVDQYGCLIPGCQGDYSSAEEEALEAFKLAIYPNPASDFLNFELRNGHASKDTYFRIIDGLGRIVQDIPSRQVKGTVVVPLDGWQGGMYWLQYVEGGEVVLSEGFMVQG